MKKRELRLKLTDAETSRLCWESEARDLRRRLEDVTADYTQLQADFEIVTRKRDELKAEAEQEEGE